MLLGRGMTNSSAFWHTNAIARECQLGGTWYADDLTQTGRILAGRELWTAKKSLKVDRKRFEGIVQNLLRTKPLKRSKVKVEKKKPEKLFPPQK
jgi:hypothetical protein